MPNRAKAVHAKSFVALASLAVVAPLIGACSSDATGPNYGGGGGANSRANPAQVGEPVRVNANTDDLWGRGVFTLTLLETVSGAAALELVMDANRFNDPPPAGHEYILARFRVRVESTVGQDEAIQMNHARFDAVRGDGATYSHFLFVAGLQPDLRTDLYSGSEYVGWTYFWVETGDAEPVALFDGSDPWRAWFALR
jgi:hypothetical protein